VVGWERGGVGGGMVMDDGRSGGKRGAGGESARGGEREQARGEK